jgi:metallo-beta-lactamase class B
MKKLTGATVIASAADARILETGGEDDFSPFIKDLMRYTPVKADRIVEDGDQVKLGDVILTAHLTPGHTKGATTWSMKVREGERTLDVVFFSSTSISRGTKLVNNQDYPRIAEDFEKTYEKLKKLPCDVWFAPHGGAFAMTTKFAQQDRAAAPNPFIDPEGWKRSIAGAERTFREQLSAERAATTP